MAGPRSAARELNSMGVVCGWTGTSQINGQAFIHTEGKTSLLGPIPGGFSSVAFGLNSFGDAVGSGRIVVNGTTLAWPFVYTDGVMSILPTIEGYERGSAVDIDDNRLIVGFCSLQQNPSERIGCIWRDEEVIALESLIDGHLGIEVSAAGDVSATGQILCEGTYRGELVTMVLTPRKRMVGDANCNDQVNVDDLLAVINQWGPCFACGTDFDLSGQVDVNDLLVVIDHWSFN